MAYTLDMSATTQIYPVVQVSQLKKHVPPAEVIGSLEAVATDPTAEVLPLRMLSVNMIEEGGALKKRCIGAMDCKTGVHVRLGR